MSTSFLRPDKPFIYPPGNDELFEEYFYDFYHMYNINTEREYLPIFWTNLYCNRDFGRGDLSDIQKYLDGLDKNKKYFTIIQYDDGILNKVDHLDLLVFSHVGKGDITLPVINRIHPDFKRDLNRDIFCSFVGPMDNRHEVRKQMRLQLSDKDGFYIKEKVQYGLFVELMNRSLFSLCPRGYSNTTFRINESLFFGSIPIYIYDNDPVIPFDKLKELEKAIIFFHVDDLHILNAFIKNMSISQIKECQKNGKLIWEKYFKYRSCADEIIKILKEK
jgi:hypothetical protein